MGETKTSSKFDKTLTYGPIFLKIKKLIYKGVRWKFIVKT